MSEVKLSNNILKNSRMLLRRMNDCTKYSENLSGTGFTSKMCSGIQINGLVGLLDSTFYCAPVKSKDLYKGNAVLEYGKQGSITFDKQTGVIKSQKGNIPFKTVNEHLLMARKKFKKQGTVNKIYLGIQGFTQKGLDKLMDAVDNVERKRTIKSKQPWYATIVKFLKYKKR